MKVGLYGHPDTLAIQEDKIRQLAAEDTCGLNGRGLFLGLYHSSRTR